MMERFGLAVGISSPGTVEAADKVIGELDYIQLPLVCPLNPGFGLCPRHEGRKNGS